MALKRLGALIDSKNFSGAEIGRLIGVSKKSISDWKLGKSEPSIEQQKALANVLGVTVSELVGDGAARDPVIKSGRFAKIPIYEVEASAGHGCLNDTEAVENYLTIDRELVKSELQCNPDNLAIIRVRGDSMAPTIKPGEMVVIDKTVNTIISDGLYVMRMTGDVVVVKRVQTLPKSLNIISDNKAYPPYQVGFDDIEGLAVIGRVLAIISMEKVGA